MPIQVTCSSCHSRFSVSDKFAGKTGPCPKCKTPLRVPTKDEEVVIHGPQEFGPKTATGEGVLKPIEREESKITTPFMIAIGAAMVLIVVVAFLMGRMADETGVPMVYKAIGAALIAPAMALAAYSFLRNDELQPYRGLSLAMRVSICGVVYTGLWGFYAYIGHHLFGGDPPELYALIVIIPILIGIGAIAPLAALDLDMTSACLHYGLYLGVCVLLRLVMGLSPF